MLLSPTTIFFLFLIASVALFYLPDVQWTRDILSHELPFPEILEVDMFPRFPELPVEIRVKIWRGAFPDDCHRDLDFTCGTTLGKLPQFQPPHGDRARLSTPVTLYINKESRLETLKEYSVLLPSQPEGGHLHRWGKRFDYNGCGKPTRPIILKASGDSAYMTHESLKNPTWLNNWVWQTEIRLNPSELLRAIRTQEIRDVEWAPYVDPTDDSILFWSKRRKKHEMWHLGTLVRFPSLEKLYFTCRTRSDRLGDRASVKEVILDYLEDKKEAFHGSRIPEVVIRSYRDVSFHSML